MKQARKFQTGKFPAEGFVPDDNNGCHKAVHACRDLAECLILASSFRKKQEKQPGQGRKQVHGSGLQPQEGAETG